jgi:hypothetical protein
MLRKLGADINFHYASIPKVDCASTAPYSSEDDLTLIVSLPRCSRSLVVYKGQLQIALSSLFMVAYLTILVSVHEDCDGHRAWTE